MVWLQQPSHKTRKKAKRLGIGSVPEMVVFPRHWFMRTEISLLGWILAAPRGQHHPFTEVCQELHILRTWAQLPGTTWCLQCSCNITLSLYSCRGGGNGVKETQTHFKCKHQGNSLHWKSAALNVRERVLQASSASFQARCTNVGRLLFPDIGLEREKEAGKGL